jgi:tetratricopeptide (TPR) repeat protein
MPAPVMEKKPIPDSISIELSFLSILTGINFDSMDNEGIRLELTRIFEGLVAEPVIEFLDDGFVRVHFKEGGAKDKARALELAERGVKRAKEGNYAKAIDLMVKSLDIDGLNTRLRRDLAMAYYELGKFEDAIDQLITALKVDPNDDGTLVVLANAYVKSQKDYETAKILLKRAIKIAPDNVWAINSLGAVHFESGDYHLGVRALKDAIAIDPTFPNAYLGLAMAHKMRGKWGDVESVIRDMFSAAIAVDVRSMPMFERAGTLFGESQTQLAAASAEQNILAVERFMNMLTEKSGHAVDVRYEDLKDGRSAFIRFAWRYNSDRHVLTVRESFPKHLAPHVMLHELMHLDMETAARAAGRNRFFATSDTTKKVALEQLKSELWALRRANAEDGTVDALFDSMFSGLCGFVYNLPLDMIIERRIREAYPDLRHAQYLSLKLMHLEAEGANFNRSLGKFVPKMIIDASIMLNGVMALFNESLFPKVFEFTKNYRPHPTFRKSTELFYELLSAADSVEPGGEYALVDLVANRTGVEGWYTWVHDPSGPSDDAALYDAPERSQPTDLSRYHEAAVFYCLDAIRRFHGMNRTGVQEISFEIAALGTHGLDYTDAKQKYSLVTIPGKKFTGLQLMCLMYCGFKVLEPSMDTGMDLAGPYRDAKALFDMGMT